MASADDRRHDDDVAALAQADWLVSIADTAGNGLDSIHADIVLT
ncbi:MAG TPA: hypothetical protein VJR71_12860 [Pseudolabrys sp.]|nr:hypothetical protein [Pseudolabrys sp.]